MSHAIEHPATCAERATTGTEEHRCLLDPGHRYPTARRGDRRAPVVHVCVCWYRWTDTPTPIPSPADTRARETVHPEELGTIGTDSAGSSGHPDTGPIGAPPRPVELATTEDRT